MGTTRAAVWHIRVCGQNADHLVYERRRRAEYWMQMQRTAVLVKGNHGGVGGLMKHGTTDHGTRKRKAETLKGARGNRNQAGGIGGQCGCGWLLPHAGLFLRTKMAARSQSDVALVHDHIVDLRLGAHGWGFHGIRQGMTCRLCRR